MNYNIVFMCYVATLFFNFPPTFVRKDEQCNLDSVWHSLHGNVFISTCIFVVITRGFFVLLFYRHRAGLFFTLYEMYVLLIVPS